MFADWYAQYGQEHSEHINNANNGSEDVKRAARQLLATFPQPPPLSADEKWYFQAFSDLQFDRPQAMNGLMPIPLMTIIKYAEYYNLSELESDLLIRLVRIIDMQYIAHVNKRSRNK